MITSFVLSVLCFIVSIPLGAIKLTQDAIILREKVKDKTKKSKFTKLRDTAMTKIGLKRKKKAGSRKKDALKSKGKIALANAVKATATAAVAVLRLLAGVLSGLAAMLGVYEIFAIFLIVAAVAVIPLNFGNDSAKSTGTSYQYESLYKDESDGDRVSEKTSYGTVVVDASVEEMLNWSDTEVWQNISGGRYNSKQDFYEDYANNREEMKTWLDGYMIQITVPAWVWTDGNKTAVKASTKTLTVNPNLANYWTEFFTALYEAPEHYVIETLGCYSFRNVGGSANVSDRPSIHCTGCAVDINGNSEGMGYKHTDTTGLGAPFRSVNDFPSSAPYLNQLVCTYDNTFYDIAVMSYGLDWGGTWITYDGMHFSFPGTDSAVGNVTVTRRKNGDSEPIWHPNS